MIANSDNFEQQLQIRAAFKVKIRSFQMMPDTCESYEARKLEAERLDVCSATVSFIQRKLKMPGIELKRELPLRRRQICFTPVPYQVGIYLRTLTLLIPY